MSPAPRIYRRASALASALALVSALGLVLELALGLAVSVAARPALAGDGLDAARLGVLYNRSVASSAAVARSYARQRAVPPENLIAVDLEDIDVLHPDVFKTARDAALARLPARVQSLLLVWTKPYAVGCMSITTAFAAGFRPEFCAPSCGRTTLNPLFDAAGWLPADTVGWWPSMLLPSDDAGLAAGIIRRGLAADGSAPAGTVYLVRTQDATRNVRAALYDDTALELAGRVRIQQLTTPVSHEIPDAIGYFTGIARVDELPRIHFRPGAIADHLTSAGGVLDGGSQMSAIAWLRQGATASYGTVSEPCNHQEKFPRPDVFFAHYLRGETLIEAYWKSVAMPGQGIFIGEPLARPYATRMSPR